MVRTVRPALICVSMTATAPFRLGLTGSIGAQCSARLPAQLHQIKCLGLYGLPHAAHTGSSWRAPASILHTMPTVRSC